MDCPSLATIAGAPEAAIRAVVAPTDADRPTDRGRLPQRMSEGLVGAGNRCAAAAAAEALASPES